MKAHPTEAQPMPKKAHGEQHQVSAQPTPQVNNPKFVAAIAAMRKDNNPQTLNLMINELMHAVFLTPAVIEFAGEKPKPDIDGKVRLPKDTKLSFSILTTKDNQKYLMGFTDAAEMKKWRSAPGQQTVLFRFDDFASFLANNHDLSGFVVNPMEQNLRFESKMVASLKARKDELSKAVAEGKTVRRNLNPDSKIVVLEPTVYPDKMLDAICAELGKKPSVQAAYLQVMVVDDTEKNYLLVVDGPQDDELFQAIGDVARPYLKDAGAIRGLSMCITTDPLGQQALEGAEPFYTRALGRIQNEDDDEDDE